MTERSAPIYPDKKFEIDLNESSGKSKNNNGGSKIRMREINRIRDKLEHDIGVRRKLSKGYKRFYNGLHGTSIGTSSIATCLAGVTLGTMSNPIIVLPLAITNVSLGAIGTLTGVWAKLIRKRIDKHQRLYLLASSALQTVNELLSESLKDSHIADEEFKNVLSVYQRYLWDCKGQNDAYAKGTLVEKDELMKTLNTAFNK